MTKKWQRNDKKMTTQTQMQKKMQQKIKKMTK